MGKVVEAKLLLTGEDRGASAAFDKAAKAVRQFQREAQISGTMRRLAADMDKAERALAAVQRTASARGGFSTAQATMQKTGAEATRLARELDAARRAKVAFDGQKLAKGSEAAQSYAAAAKAVRELTREHRAAEREAARAASAFHAEQRAMQQAERAASALGIDLARLEQHERTLKGSVESAAAALRRQAQAEETAARAARHHARERAEAASHMRRHGLAGAAAAAASGYVGVHGVTHAGRHALAAGAEVQGVRVDMQKAGIPAAERRHIEDQALALAVKYKNVTQASIMELHKEIRSVMTDPNEVDHVIEPLVQAKALLDARDRSGKASENLQMLVKGAEVIGAAKSPGRLTHLIDGYVKAMQVMGKTITPESIYEYDKYSKLGGARLSDRFLLTTAQSLSQELGGSTAGLGAGGFYKQIAGGMQNLHTAAREFAAVGLIAEKDLDYTKTGEVKGVKRGVRHAVQGDDLAATDPDKWVYQVLLPALASKGITQEADQLNWIRKAFPNGNVADFVGKMVVQRHSFEAHAAQYEGAMGLKGTALNREDPTAALGAVSKSLETFAGVLTSPVMKDAAHALDWMAGKIGGFTQSLEAFNKAHPDLAKAEAPVAGAVALGGAGAASALVWKALSGDFGLKGSATALTHSAAMLDAAALKLGAGGGKDLVKDAGKTAAGGALAGAGTAAILGSGAVAGALLDNAMPKAVGSGKPFGDQVKDLAAMRERVKAEEEAQRKELRAIPSMSFPSSDALSIGGSGLTAFRPKLGMEAMQAGKEAGTTLGSGIAKGVEAAGAFILDEAQDIYGKLKRLFSEGIRVPISFTPGEGGFGGGSGGIVKASYSPGGGGGSMRPAGTNAFGGIDPLKGGGGGASGSGSGSWYDAVIAAEGTARGGRDPYNTVLGYGRYGTPSKPLTDMTLAEAHAFGRTVRARHGSSSALGAFQIVGRTMRTFMGEAGLGWDDKFSPENQRRLADVVRRRQGFGAWEGFKRHPGELVRARRGVSAPSVPGPIVPPAPEGGFGNQGAGDLPKVLSDLRETVASLQNTNWRSHHTVEVAAAPGLTARTRSMRASSSGPIMADVGNSMPQTRTG